MEIPEIHISGLLEIHDCVIVPDFGGFVLNKTFAGFGPNPNELIPARKTVSFNRSLNINDGLLANHIAQEKHISYGESLALIGSAVENWKNTLSKGEKIDLEGIGSFMQNWEQKLIFAPVDNRNYSKVSFGLPSLILTPVEKQNSQKVFKIGENQASPSEGSKRFIRRSLRVAAFAAVFIVASAVIFNNIPDNKLFTAKSNQVYKSIQPIAASIGKIITEQTVKPASVQTQDASIIPNNNTFSSNSRFYIVGGSFKIEANAAKFEKELQEKGYKAQLLDNEDGWFRVTYQTEQDSLKADKDLQTIKINENQSAWILKF